MLCVGIFGCSEGRTSELAGNDLMDTPAYGLVNTTKGEREQLRYIMLIVYALTVIANYDACVDEFNDDVFICSLMTCIQKRLAMCTALRVMKRKWKTSPDMKAMEEHHWQQADLLMSVAQEVLCMTQSTPPQLKQVNLLYIVLFVVNAC